MKSVSLFIIGLLLGLSLYSQNRIAIPVIYDDFKPSVITLVDGKKISMPLTNVFLKNASLVYKKSHVTPQVLEANMKNIACVDFDDRHYIRIDSVLAYVIDSVENKVLLCCERIDLETYKKQLINNRQITNLDISSQVSMSYVDISTEEENKIPVFSTFYYFYNGKYIKVHERNLRRIIPKDKQRIFKTHISDPAFDWTKASCLLKLLKDI